MRAYFSSNNRTLREAHWDQTLTIIRVNEEKISERISGTYALEKKIMITLR